MTITRTTNTRLVKPKRNQILSDNLDLIRQSLGYSVRDFCDFMGWGSVKTYYDKSEIDAVWKPTEINYLCNKTGLTYEDIFIISLSPIKQRTNPYGVIGKSY